MMPDSARALFEHAPAVLRTPGPGGVLYWQWLAIPLVLAISLLAGLALGRVSRSSLGRVARRTASQWDDALLDRSRAPLTLCWTLACCFVLLPWLGLPAGATALAKEVQGSALLLAFFWLLFGAVDVAAGAASRSDWANTYPASRSLVSLGARILKVCVVGIAAVAMLAQFGYPVASLVAGLGIGGLAVALAGQKTIENLFGAFSLGVDQPFREGDFVKIEDFVGTVEAIGLRSTRVRTLDRTLISIPNGKLAELRIESFAARDRMRLACTLGLVYGTSAAQIRRILADLERVLRAHPQIWPDAVVVRFTDFGESSLNIGVMAWFQTQDWNEFQVMRENVLLDFMGVVEAAGSAFAFPTRTLHLESTPSGKT